MRRVANWANTMRPSATIQVATREFVTGKPNGLAISTAFCEGPCSSGTAVADPVGSTALVEIAEAVLSSTFVAKAQTVPRHMTTATKSTDISLFFNLARPRHSDPSHPYPNYFLVLSIQDSNPDVCCWY